MYEIFSQLCLQMNQCVGVDLRLQRTCIFSIIVSKLRILQNMKRKSTIKNKVGKT